MGAALEDFYPEKGVYLLLLYLRNRECLVVGRLGEISFAAGYYAYLGSAMGGFRARLCRHLRKEKKPHWHVDYLLQKAPISRILLCESAEKIECRVALALAHVFPAVAEFGASDCRSASHLFYAGEPEELTAVAVAVLASYGQPHVFRLA
jgi:sugar fermentation stimulation protein A